MGLMAQLFTWWNGETIATRFFTWRKGRRVGDDAEGNVYYQNADGSRRWVIFAGDSEASRIPPEWHGWLHHTWQQPPTEAPLPRKVWEKPHLANQTGSDSAYRPSGSLLSTQGPRASDYEPWSPS